MTSDRISQVFVHPEGHSDVSYVCMATPLGWKCGKCGHGNLGPDPRVGQYCAVCRSHVSHVNKGPQIQWRMPSGAYY
jgi:hypothetical protein